MAVSRSRTRSTETELHHLPSKWKDDTTGTHSPTSNLRNDTIPRKVPVVYYLSRNGHLEHPHFIEVPLLSSPDGLYLNDVINRLNVLRGRGMASLYSWSSKRSYKNGFVWHDLAEADFIYPAHGNEYVLKGSELLLLDHQNSNDNKSSLETTPCSSRSSKAQDNNTSSSSSDQAADTTRRRNQSWSSADLNEYKVYKSDSLSDSARRLAANASTQTDDKRRRRGGVIVKREEEERRHHHDGGGEEIIEISPPPSDSSPETLESLMKADGRLLLNNSNLGGESNEDGGLSSHDETVENCGRIKASSVLMQLISCGSMSFKDCGATAAVKEQGLSLIGQYKERLTRGGREIMGRSFSGVKLEDKEYFSGSLIETKLEEVQFLQHRSEAAVAVGRGGGRGSAHQMHPQEVKSGTSSNASAFQEIRDQCC